MNVFIVQLKVGGKQDKIIPNLIFAIEELERHLVKLSKKSKVYSYCGYIIIGVFTNFSEIGIDEEFLFIESIHNTHLFQENKTKM